MLLISTKSITVKLRHYLNNNGQHYFQRAVPKALRRFYDGKSIIRHKLPSDHALMLVEIDRLTREYDNHFKALKRGAEGTPAQIQEQAVALLASHGVRPGDGAIPARVPKGFYDFPNLDSIEDYFRDKKLAGTMSKIDELAAHLVTKPMPILLSQAPLIYLENHVNGQSKKFAKRMFARWRNIYEITGGDIPIEQVTRDMARQYVANRIRSVKTTTIERELKDIRAVINSVIREKELKITNQFERLVIPNKGKDSKPRDAFTDQELQSIVTACLGKADDIRILILLTCLTGARPSEIAGLRRQDIFLEDDYPHFDIVEYEGRTLKTKSSARKVPLIPIAADAVKNLLNTHQESTLFPRYCDGFSVLGDNVSGATGRYLHSIGIEKSLYSARHTVKTLLDRTSADEYLNDSIGGWGRSSISRSYGSAQGLDRKYLALCGAFGKVINR